jgi:hypothetical protein
MCASENDACTNGQPCFRDVDHDGEPYYHCQCDISPQSNTDMSSPYTYRLCPHAATTFCNRQNEGGSGKGTGSGTGSVNGTNVKMQSSGQDVSLGPSGGSYCANAGKCKRPDASAKSNGTNALLHAGCVCPPEWSGSYCEVPIGYEKQAEAAATALATSPSGVDPNSRRTLGPAVRGILSGLVILVVGIALMFWFYTGREGVQIACSWLRHMFIPRQFTGRSRSRAKRAVAQSGVELAHTYRDAIDNHDNDDTDIPPASGHAIA